MTEKDESKQEVEILTNLSRDYADYLNINTKHERTKFDESLESLMTKLDEYTGLVDMIRSDTNLSLNTMLPEMYSKGQQLEALFDKIDKLEKFVQHVKENLSEIDILIEQAESELTPKNPVTKFFTALPRPSFMGQKSTSSIKKFSQPTIFSTDKLVHACPQSTAESDDQEQGQEVKSKETNVHADIPVAMDGDEVVTTES